jgi:acylphosphatase
MDSERARVRLRIHGRVQGVMFRASAADEARILGVTGYARNCIDGSVEIVAEGRRRDLESLVAWAHRGPALAHVTRVDEEWQQFRGEFAGFAVG